MKKWRWSGFIAMFLIVAAFRTSAPAYADNQCLTTNSNSRETPLFLFIKIENTYDGVIFETNRHFDSRKANKQLHGIGMASVRDIVERHGGTLDIIYPMKEIFRIGISLPLKQDG